MDQNSSITVLKGIGSKTADKFASAGIFTVDDLIRYYPRTYESFDEPGELQSAADGRKVAVCGFVMAALSVRYAGRYQIITGKIRTETEQVPVTWFNMPYLRRQVEPGRTYVFRGTAKQKGKQLILLQPQIFSPEEYAQKQRALQPVYSLRAGLTEKTLRKAIAQALDAAGPQREMIPEGIRARFELAAADAALRQIHFPEDLEHCLEARKRLVFEEFLLFILALRQMRESRETYVHDYRLKSSDWARKVTQGLPFRLTGAQQRVWQQVEQDMEQEKVMFRLVQGDVGSGKTIIAFLALIMAAENGGQGALMAPTEVLARQHYAAFCRLAEQFSFPIKAELLTGSATAKEKREAYERIASGETSVVIGTHALIQEKVAYRKLVLVITDEQHRFGVRQRETLFGKGMMPHTLVMSATPIPRTLAVILYGDMDVSVIDEMPGGRLAVKNCVVTPSWRPNACRFIRKEAEAGHQAYVICPMVESSDVLEAENVIDYAASLREHLPKEITVEYLHGKMKPKEKNAVMERFAAGEIQVLVSTTVVEVGVDVPRATVMMIEDAQRFGLAQLHQLRGRVGRGDAQSYCILVDTSGRKEADRRLQVMNQSNDGFRIAQQDLEMRGPGDVFGIRQSGLMDFQLGDVFTDADTLKKASEAAGMILQEDPDLSGEQCRELKKRLQMYLKNSAEHPMA